MAMPARASSEQQNLDILQNALQLNNETVSPNIEITDLNVAELMGNIINGLGSALKIA